LGYQLSTLPVCFGPKSRYFVNTGAVQPDWVRDNVPWLSGLTRVFGLARDDDMPRDNCDNG
jgi:hypothetical protein